MILNASISNAARGLKLFFRLAFLLLGNITMELKWHCARFFDVELGLMLRFLLLPIPPDIVADCWAHRYTLRLFVELNISPPPRHVNEFIHGWIPAPHCKRKIFKSHLRELECVKQCARNAECRMTTIIAALTASAKKIKLVFCQSGLLSTRRLPCMILTRCWEEEKKTRESPPERLHGAGGSRSSSIKRRLCCSFHCYFIKKSFPPIISSYMWCIYRKCFPSS